MGFVLGQLYVYSNLSIYHTLANVMLSVIPQVGIGESFSGFFPAKYPWGQGGESKFGLQ